MLDTSEGGQSEALPTLPEDSPSLETTVQFQHPEAPVFSSTVDLGVGPVTDGRPVIVQLTQTSYTQPTLNISQDNGLLHQPLDDNEQDNMDADSIPDDTAVAIIKNDPDHI